MRRVAERRRRDHRHVVLVGLSDALLHALLHGEVAGLDRQLGDVGDAGLRDRRQREPGVLLAGHVGLDAAGLVFLRAGRACNAPIMPVPSVAALPASQTVEIQLSVAENAGHRRYAGFRTAQPRPPALTNLNHRRPPAICAAFQRNGWRQRAAGSGKARLPHARVAESMTPRLTDAPAPPRWSCRRPIGCC